MIDLEGYVILVAHAGDGRIRLFGSPACHSDLEVGDEIMEVNGQHVDGCTHHEIIQHIHKCIQSRTIKLRVKRTPNDVPLPHTGLSDLQDAYVIAVDEEARKRLDELTALRQIRPVDISKVHDLGNNNNSLALVDTDSVTSAADNPDSSNLSEDPDEGITVFVSDPCQRACEEVLLKKKAAEDPEEGVCCPSGGVEGGGGIVSPLLSPGEESILTDQCLDSRGASTVTTPCSLSSCSMESGVVNGYMDVHAHHPHSHLGGAVNGNMRYNMSGHDNMFEDSGDDLEPAETSHHQQQQQQQQHREMAIDCPPSFVGVKKEPPRYPPPQSATNSPRHYPAGAVHDSPRTPAGMPQEVNYQQPPKMTPDEELKYMEHIKKYQDDLRRRKEEEERITREQEFLRTSLRGSEKLKALENKDHKRYSRQLDNRLLPSGIVNPNYIGEEELAARAEASSAPPPKHNHGDGCVPVGPEVLLGQVSRWQHSLKSIDDQKELNFLHNLIQKPGFQSALDMYHKVVDVSLNHPRPTPIVQHAQELAIDVASLLPSNSSPATDELRGLLNSLHIKGVLLSHDKLAELRSDAPKNTTEDDEREYLYERASQYGEEIKIVRLQKTADPLGATVRNENDQQVVIGRIVKGGAAEKSGLLHEGDEILEINGIDVRGKCVNDVCDLMASLTGTLTFLINPCPESEPSRPSNKLIHIRALFDYDPEDDPYIPCRELGVSFQKMDVLHVQNQEDPNWWQAYREGEDDQSLAGLIPSKTFQEQREAIKQTIVSDSYSEDKKKHKCRCVRKSSKKKKKKLYNAAGEELEAEEILSYEDVALYYPQPNRKRPVVLIGPPNVGRQELRQRLMESQVDRFGAAIPHTSRQLKDGEQQDRDYHCVPRHQFEQDILDHKFVEYGEYERNLYGTSIVSIQEVVTLGKICVLNLHPSSLRILKASDLKPYVVFIAPPNIDKLKALRQRQGVKLTDSELIEIKEKAHEMEENYGHYFDMYITNYDLDKAFDELLAEINRLEVEPQWVPAHWVT